MKRRSRLRFLQEAVEGSAVLLVATVTWPISRRWLRNWGSSEHERQGPWPGDALVSANLSPTTRAIEIGAPAKHVWPWLVQFGLDKAGFYSYELLERMIGIPVTNLESIEFFMQSINVGDEVRLHPKAPGIPVALIEPERHICFGKARDSNAGSSREDLKRSWSIYITPTGADTCRLVVRGCFEETRKRPVQQRMAFALEQPIDFTMEQRMLRTVKRLAETGAGQRH